MAEAARLGRDADNAGRLGDISPSLGASKRLSLSGKSRLLAMERPLYGATILNDHSAVGLVSGILKTDFE